MNIRTFWLEEKTRYKKDVKDTEVATNVFIATSVSFTSLEMLYM